MGVLMLLVSMLLFVPVTVQAEVVSIMLSTPGYDGMMVEAAMKRQLREEGYTVRTGTAEGIVVLLNVIAPKTTQRHQPRYVGHVTLLTFDWQQVGDLFVAEPCKETHTTAQEVKGLVGAPVILIDTAMGAARTPDDLANMLMTSINPSIRKSFQTMQAFFIKLDEVSKTKQQSEVMNPLR
jgi:hypothetical protein